METRMTSIGKKGDLPIEVVPYGIQLLEVLDDHLCRRRAQATVTGRVSVEAGTASLSFSTAQYMRKHCDGGHRLQSSPRAETYKVVSAMGGREWGRVTPAALPATVWCCCRLDCRWDGRGVGWVGSVRFHRRVQFRSRRSRDGVCPYPANGSLRSSRWCYHPRYPILSSAYLQIFKFFFFFAFARLPASVHIGQVGL